MSFTFCEFDLQLLNLGFGFLATVFGVCFALCQSLHLDLQLVPLAFQGLLGFLHRHLVLQEMDTWPMLLLLFRCLLSISLFWPPRSLPSWPFPAAHWSRRTPGCVFVSCQPSAARGAWPRHPDSSSDGRPLSHAWTWRDRTRKWMNKRDARGGELKRNK